MATQISGKLRYKSTNEPTLSANKIVSRSDIGWDLEEDLAAVLVHIVCAPVLRIATNVTDQREVTYLRGVN
jgi:hypothetical protein